MYGDADETTWADSYIADDLHVWTDMPGLKGTAPCPLGLGQAEVEQKIALLIMRWRIEGMSEAQRQCELRNLAAGFGWIAKDKVGAKPE